MPLSNTFALRGQPQMTAPGMAGDTGTQGFSGNVNASASADVQATGLVILVLLAVVILSPKVLG